MSCQETYLFVIDTNEYSGNFNRELAGYVTGNWDQETHGGDEAEIARKELTEAQSDYLRNHNEAQTRAVDDGHAHVNHVIHPTPGWWNDGRGLHFKGKPPKGKQAHPAYQSVAIFFNGMPLAPMVQVMMERAKAFCKYMAGHKEPWKKKTNLKILGFRILLEVIQTTEAEVWRAP